jgi:hypothetical protein
VIDVDYLARILSTYGCQQGRVNIGAVISKGADQIQRANHTAPAKELCVSSAGATRYLSWPIIDLPQSRWWGKTSTDLPDCTCRAPYSVMPRFVVSERAKLIDGRMQVGRIVLANSIDRITHTHLMAPSWACVVARRLSVLANVNNFSQWRLSDVWRNSSFRRFFLFCHIIIYAGRWMINFETSIILVYY